MKNKGSIGLLGLEKFLCLGSSGRELYPFKNCGPRQHGRTDPASKWLNWNSWSLVILAKVCKSHGSLDVTRLSFSDVDWCLLLYQCSRNDSDSMIYTQLNRAQASWYLPQFYIIQKSNGTQKVPKEKKHILLLNQTHATPTFCQQSINIGWLVHNGFKFQP